MGVFEDVGDFLGLGKKEEEEPKGEIQEELEHKEEVQEAVEEEVEVEVEEAEEVVETEEKEVEEVEEVTETVEETVEKETEEIEETPEEVLKKQNEALLKRLDEIEGKQKPAKVAEKEEPAAEVSFLGEEDDIDSYLNDKTKLNGLLVKVYNKALADAGTQFNGNVPSVVVEQIQKHMILKEGIDEFFSANKDLVPVRKTVGAITNEIVAEHDDWTLKEVLVETEKRSRETLGIKKKVETTRKRNPALVDKGSSRKKVTDQRSPVQKEVDDLIS